MDRLDSITIKGFKSIASVEGLKLGAVNVLIGANGSGKSNFISAFQFLKAVRAGRLGEFTARAGGADRILHFGMRATRFVEIRIDSCQSENQYEIKIEPTHGDGFHPVAEYLSAWNQRSSQPYTKRLSPKGGEAGISDAASIGPTAARRGKDLLGFLDRWMSFHFHDTGPSSPLKKTADLHDNRGLRSDGSNLAAYLYLLRVKHESSYRQVRDAVRSVAPFFDDFQLEPTRLNADKIRLEWNHKGSDAFFDVSSLSDGTLRFVALATLFLQPRELLPSLILVDEPELGLNPYAIVILGALIRQASFHAQVVVSTQSPLLLDQFQPEDVLVADRVGGGTTFTRLDAGKLTAWLEDYSLGELWEKNEFGGRPREA